jgi:hypothetical protein
MADYRFQHKGGTPAHPARMQSAAIAFDFRAGLRFASGPRSHRARKQRRSAAADGRGDG